MLVIATETTRQVLARREFEAGRARLGALFEQAPGFIATFRGPDHVFEFVNAEHRRLFGSAHLIGKPLAEVFPEQGQQGFFDQVYGSGERRVVYATPFRFRVGGEGEPELRFLDFLAAPIKNADGEVTGLYTQGQDVTDRVRAQAALGESEARFRALAETIPAILFIADPDGANTYTNPPYQRFSGLSAEELAGDGWVQSVHPDDRERAAAAWEASWRRGKPYDIEFRFRRHDGEHRWHSVRGSPVYEGEKVASWVGVGVDIHNQKLAEEALRDLNANLERRVGEALAERKLWADLMENSEAYITVIDTEYRLSAINKAAWNAALRFYGIEPTIGASLFDLIGDWPEARARTERAWVRPLSGEAYSLAEPFVDRVGQLRHHESRYDAVRNADGEIIGAYQISYDVTDRVLEQARLAEAEAALRQAQKMESLGPAHRRRGSRLQQPAHADRRGAGHAPTSGCGRRARPAPDRRRAAIRRAGPHARPETARLRPASAPRPGAVDVGELILGMTELLESTVGPQVRLAIEIEPDLPPALADANQLELALLNLGVNARDAMPDGGALTFAVHLCHVKVGEHTDLPRGDYICVKVTDTGLGMDEEVRSKAIEPFFSTKIVGQGTGLGLSMVDGLVRQLGGALAIHSEPGEGTSITLWLPLGEAAAQTPASGRPSLATGSTGVVLLVDDEDLVRATTAQMIEFFGYAVIEAPSGESALAKIEAGLKPDLLVTDQLMDGITGDALARAARRLLPGLPVLVVSGYADMDGLSPDLPRLGKPFRAEALGAALAALRA